MYLSTARFPTQHASKYIQQLCKHFAHKIEVDYDEQSGSAALPMGPAKLTAEPDSLLVQVQAEDVKGVIHARFVIDSHLVTFAFREGYTGLNWDLAEA